ncbi:MAG: Asp-tRNA(Asn)/Glu-tRNA(Gln) amidotransferase subunit GatC [Candidatus Binatota bacterium]
MKITRDEVRRVALLARLQLSQQEEEIFTGQLDKILQYVEKLNQLDTANVEPLAHVVDIVNPWRADHVVNRPSPDAMLANAPARERDFLKVPKIIE